MSGKAHNSLYEGNDIIVKYYHEIPKKFNVSQLIGMKLDFIKKEGMKEDVKDFERAIKKRIQ